MRWTIRGAAGLAAVWTATLALGGCSPPKPPAETRLLEIDGITITFDELRPYVEFVNSYRPKLGEKTKHVWVMRDYLLPLKVARRTFAKERAEQLELAKGLSSVATNIVELEKQSELKRDKTRINLTREKAHLPVAMFLFDQMQQGAASQPLEVPQGYFVVGSYGYHESPLITVDYVDALQVGFVTHTSHEWQEFWVNEQQRLADKVTFVHPDYRDDLPKWMKPPKKP